MKILVLVHEFPPVGGGGGRIAQEAARELAKRGHAVHVIAPHVKGLAFRDQIDNIHVIRIPSFRRRLYEADLFAMAGYLLSGSVAALCEIKKFRPDLIHVHFAVPAGALAWLLSRLTGIPYVLTTHLGDIPGGVPEKTDAWFHWIYPFTPRIWRDAAAVTAISEFTRQLALLHYPVPIQVIPNGIHIDDVIQPDNLIVGTPPKIVFAGRFVEQKNPVHIVRILHEVRDLAWQAQLIGDGALFENVRAEIHRLGLERRILLTGWLSVDRIGEAFRQSDILLMPSLSEGIPMVALQALSNGLAIVASRVGGLTELVLDGENGFLLEPHDTAGFSASLRCFLTDRSALLAAKRSSLKLSHKFDLMRTVDAYERAFESALKKAKSAEK
jgi:glycosyltransferase involved in cell wall biosynthesis